MTKARCGPGIREFLTYYVLALLDGRKRTMQQLVEEIEARSAENRSYRTDGALRVGSRDMEEVIYSLAHRGWVRLRPPGARWGITSAGRRARREMERTARGSSRSKQRGASKLMARLKQAPRGSYVLDAGTGEGFLARKLAEQGLRVLGIDSGAFEYSKDSIDRARQDVGSQSARLEFRRADVTELRRPRRGFDYVVSSQAVHCMDNQRKCLQAIHRLLKPGGRFLSLDFLVGLEGFLAHGFHCFLAISREEWERILPTVGFDDIQTQKVGDYLIVDARKARGHPGRSRAPAQGAEVASEGRPNSRRRSKDAAVRV